MTIKVSAAPGLRVPCEHNPHEYIGQTAVSVPDTLYYRRLIADGDLKEVSEATGKKKGEA